MLLRKGNHHNFQRQEGYIIVPIKLYQKISYYFCPEKFHEQIRLLRKGENHEVNIFSKEIHCKNENNYSVTWIWYIVLFTLLRTHLQFVNVLVIARSQLNSELRTLVKWTVVERRLDFYLLHFHFTVDTFFYKNGLIAAYIFVVDIDRILKWQFIVVK